MFFWDFFFFVECIPNVGNIKHNDNSPLLPHVRNMWADAENGVKQNKHIYFNIEGYD
jgi:hypothetical protein